MPDALTQFQGSGSYNRRQGSGRKNCTIRRKDRFTLLFVLRDCRTTSSLVAQRLRNVMIATVSARTVIEDYEKTMFHLENLQQAHN